MKDEEDEDIKIEDLMNNIYRGEDEEDNQKFRLQERKNQKLYVFEKMEVQKLYSVLMNHVIQLI